MLDVIFFSDSGLLFVINIQELNVSRWYLTKNWVNPDVNSISKTILIHFCLILKTKKVLNLSSSFGNNNEH